MDSQDRLSRPHWRVGDVIRHKQTAKPFRVIHIYKFLSTILIDLEDHAPLPSCLILLPRNYDDYCKDADLQMKGDTWTHLPVSL